MLSEFEQVVLLAVARVGRDAYGMAVRDELTQRLGRSVSLAAVYSTLARLEGAGLVCARIAPPTARRGGRATKYFDLNRAGAVALRDKQEMLARMWDGLELTSYLEGG